MNDFPKNLLNDKFFIKYISNLIAETAGIIAILPLNFKNKTDREFKIRTAKIYNQNFGFRINKYKNWIKIVVNHDKREINVELSLLFNLDVKPFSVCQNLKDTINYRLQKDLNYNLKYLDVYANGIKS